MLRGSAVPARIMPSRIQSWCNGNSVGRADQHCGLRAKLAITDGQMEAWAAYAEALLANDRRVRSFDDGEDHPFGPLEDRLAALASMRQAAVVLFSVLDATQQRKAMHLLPICCLPGVALLD